MFCLITTPERALLLSHHSGRFGFFLVISDCKQDSENAGTATRLFLFVGRRNFQEKTTDFGIVFTNG
jgi:hypothetical protein